MVSKDDLMDKRNKQGGVGAFLCDFKEVMLELLSWLRRPVERADNIPLDVLLIPDYIPRDIVALLPFPAYQRQPAFDRWVQRYEAAFADSCLPRKDYERVMFALLSLGKEPTVAVEAFQIVSGEYTGR